MPYRYFHNEQHDGILVARIHNPPRNFMRTGMVFELKQLADDATKDESIKVVILTSDTPGYFIAHADLDAVASTDPNNPDSRKYYLAWHAAMNSLAQCPAVVISAINGNATGGGCEVAPASDLRFMARGQHLIGLLESGLHILAGSGGTQRAARLLGPAKALELMLEGRLLSPDEALAFGLVNRVYEQADLLPKTLEYARAVATKPRPVLAHIKRCVHEGLQHTLVDGLKLEQELFLDLIASPPAQSKLKEGAKLYKDHPELPFSAIMARLGMTIPPGYPR